MARPARGQLLGARRVLRRQRLGERPGWCDRQRRALAFGALLVGMLAGFLGSSTWPTIDLAGKIVLNGIAIALMVALAHAVWTRDPLPSIAPAAAPGEPASGLRS